MGRKIVEAEEATERRQAVADACAIVGSTRLLTFGPEDPRWAQIAADEVIDLREVEGAIVRVEPPESASPEHVELFARTLHLLGASATKLLPRRVGAVVPEEATRHPAKGRRDVVLSLVAEARTDDAESLREVVVAAMNASGL